MGGYRGPVNRSRGCGQVKNPHDLSALIRSSSLPTRRQPECLRLLSCNKRSIPMDWRDKAACLTADPELFFPVGNTGPAVDQIEKAKQVCGRCPVTEVCLQYALETGQDSGVWGGLSEDERRALKRRAARARRSA
ncbi:hypothetical protein GCM10022288_13040 [Gryllotalpicola kribbensis]